MMRHRTITVTPIFLWYYLKSIKFTAMLLVVQTIQHLIHQIINIQQFQFHAGVIHRIRQVVGKSIAERRHGRVVVRTAPFPKQIRETIDKHFCASFLLILQEQVLAGLLRAAILAIAKAACKRSLLRRGQHHRTFVPILLQRIQQGWSKPEVTFHKLRSLLRSVHPGKVKNEVSFLTIHIQQCRIRINVILVHLVYLQVWETSVLPLLYIAKVCTEVFSNETLCTCN